MLLPVLGRDDVGRRVLINTIGPVWDANEVWVLVAGAGIFAAFPYWYATLFSGFYLALLLILLALIVRGVAFEYRGKVDDPRWRARWDATIVLGSAVPALLWGVAFANIVRGVPIDVDGNYTGTLLTLLNPYGLLGGLVTLSLRAAQHPPILELSVAVVAVRAFAIGRGVSGTWSGWSRTMRRCECWERCGRRGCAGRASGSTAWSTLRRRCGSRRDRSRCRPRRMTCGCQVWWRAGRAARLPCCAASTSRCLRAAGSPLSAPAVPARAPWRRCCCGSSSPSRAR
jgi:hypothetical protein